MSNIVFYYFPTSFYSQKARLALEEKGLQYTDKIISLSHNDQNQPWYLRLNPNGEVPTLQVGDQNQPWYLRLNPNGEVPTLQVGDQCYTESEKIMDVVDQLSSDTPWKLIPDPNSHDGRLVSHWRKLIDEVDVPNMTFGVLAYPDLSPGGLGGMPAALRPSREGIMTRFEGSIKEAEKTKIEHPELADACDRKIGLYKKRLVDFFDKDKIQKVLDGAENKMAEIEQQLHKMATEKAGSKHFLCGNAFTAADINLCVLLGRMRMLGLLPRFADPQKYPNLAKYWERIQKRASVQKVVLNNLAEAKRYMMGRKLKGVAGNVGMVAVGVGVVGLAVWVAHRHLKN